VLCSDINTWYYSASSKWLKQFQDDLVFQSFDLKALKFTYGKVSIVIAGDVCILVDANIMSLQYYTLSVTWDVPSAAQAPKYMLSLGCTSSTQKDKENVVIAETLGRTQKNPHWRIQKLLENSLNEHKDWIMFIQASPTFLPSSSDAM
jgi:hypothetical protein